MDGSSSALLGRLVAVAREPVTIAILVALVVTTILGVVVVATWSVVPGGSPPPTANPIPAAALSTPTPRAIAVRRATPPPLPPTPTPTPTVEAPTAVAPTDPAPAPTAPPRPRPSPTAASAPPSEPVFLAADASDFSVMATSGWTIEEDQLVFDSVSTLSEPWLVAPQTPPAGEYAIEVDMRVTGLADGVCDQSFGVVAGAESRGITWGAGVIYRCGGRSPQARLTDVSNWSDGYNQDRELDAKNFEPERNWHTYRLEVRGNSLRLLIDGRQLLTAEDNQAEARLDGRSRQVGLWTQGVRLTVRRIALYELEPDAGG